MRLVLFAAASLLGVAASVPLADPSELGSPCSREHGDCPTLTCIPDSANCTIWGNAYTEGCAGTCQPVDLSHQKIYTLCGGWSMMDDCDERIEYCVADPRYSDRCGPSCDGPGICVPNDDYCGWEMGKECRPGTTCFLRDDELSCIVRDLDNGTKTRTCGGLCLPLRFGSDTYGKTKQEEIQRNDQDGYQGREGEP